MAPDLWMVEAMIQPFKLETVIMALAQLPGFVGVTASDCRGFGQGPLQPGPTGAVDMKGEPTNAERRPVDIDVDDFTPKGVISVHDLHVWSITSGMTALSALVCAEKGLSNAACLDTLRQRLRDSFGIDHTTIQIEPVGYEEEEVHP